MPATCSMMMGDELAMSPEIVAEHGMALQAVDIVGQMLGPYRQRRPRRDRPDAIERIGMCELKAKLSRRLRPSHALA